MIGTIRKHQTWLWAFLITAVVISFVVYFTPTVRRGYFRNGRTSLGTIHGRPISRAQYFEAMREAQLNFFIRYGTWPDRSEANRFRYNLERETRDRLVLIEKMHEFNIQVEEGAMAQWITERFADQKQPGKAKVNYQNFIKFELPRHGVTEPEFLQFIRHEVGLAHLVGLTAIAGRLVTPREATELYRQEHEQIEAEAVVFLSTNFLASVKLEPAALEQFYTNRQSLYRIPERLQVSYVRFPLTNYVAEADAALAKITNLAAIIEQTYAARGASFYTDTNGQVMPPEAAKAKEKQNLRERQALYAAHKAAAQFGSELQTNQPVKAENLNQLAAAKGMPVRVTDPFSEFETPRNLAVDANFSQAAYKLTPEQPISSPIRAQDGVYLIALKQRLPSELPSLDSIRARVSEEYVQDQARLLARQAGTNFVTKLTNGLAAQKNWSAICAEAGVKPLVLPKFSPATRALPELDRRLDLGQLRMASYGVAAGKTSDLVTTREGALVLYVKSRAPVAEADLKKDLPKFLASLRQSRQMDAFYEWFGKQIELSRIDVPMGKEEPEEE
jgi:hypothetical protein